MWHEWNANADDITMTWLALYANLVTSHVACMMHECMDGTHALCKNNMSKYLSACMQADSNLTPLISGY